MNEPTEEQFYVEVMAQLEQQERDADYEAWLDQFYSTEDDHAIEVQH